MSIQSFTMDRVGGPSLFRVFFSLLLLGLCDCTDPQMESAIVSLLENLNLFKDCGIFLSSTLNKAIAQKMELLPQTKTLVENYDLKTLTFIQMHMSCSVLIFPTKNLSDLSKVLGQIPRSYIITFGNFSLLKEVDAQLERHVIYLKKDQVRSAFSVT